MEDFLANATPSQLLLCLAVPLVGAFIVVGFLFLSFRTRNNKKNTQRMKPGTQLQPSSLLAFTPASPADKVTSPQPSPEPPVQPDASLLLSQTLASETPGDIALRIPSGLADPAPEPELNLSILSAPTPGGMNHHAETEDFAMGPSRQPREDKMGLAARLNNRGTTVTIQSMPSQPASNPPTPTPAVAQATQPISQPQPPAKPAEPVELLRLLRNPESGQLIVEIAGRRYTRLADIADKQVGEYILKLAAHLLAFTNGMIAAEAGIKSLPAPKVGETPLPLVSPKPTSQLPSPPTDLPPASPPSPPPAPGPSPEVEAAFLASLAQPVKPLIPEPKPKRQGLFGRVKPAAEAEPLLPVLNLAEQINTIVQVRLRLSPLAATTKLEITSDPGGGIRIDVNGRFYASPEDIPDPQVKALIKESIRQWETS